MLDGQQVSTGSSQPLSDPSPSAFHPKPSDPSNYHQNDIKETTDGGVEVPENVGQGGAAMGMQTSNNQAKRSDSRGGYTTSGMLSPSEEDDLDPAGTMIHREELDDQEKLDLEEERRERRIGGDWRGVQGDVGRDQEELEGNEGKGIPPAAPGVVEPGKSRVALILCSIDVLVLLPWVILRTKIREYLSKRFK